MWSNSCWSSCSIDWWTYFCSNLQPPWSLASAGEYSSKLKSSCLESFWWPSRVSYVDISPKFLAMVVTGRLRSAEVKEVLLGSAWAWEYVLFWDEELSFSVTSGLELPVYSWLALIRDRWGGVTWGDIGGTKSCSSSFKVTTWLLILLILFIWNYKPSESTFWEAWPGSASVNCWNWLLMKSTSLGLMTSFLTGSFFSSSISSNGVLFMSLFMMKLLVRFLLGMLPLCSLCWLGDWKKSSSSPWPRHFLMSSWYLSGSSSISVYDDSLLRYWFGLFIGSGFSTSWISISTAFSCGWSPKSFIFFSLEIVESRLLLIVGICSSF